MSYSHKQVSRALESIGAGWAGWDDKFISIDDVANPYTGWLRATYHIHPDATCPDVAKVRRFSTLDAIMSYVETRRLVASRL